MKKLIMVMATVLMASIACAEVISLTSARASIGDCIQSPAKMTETMKGLSAEDQKAFVAEVSAALAKRPGSTEANAAVALNAYRAALKGAASGNTSAVLAEIFATAPAEFLPILSERFASDLFNRNADPSRPYSDEEFTKIARKLMETINDRTLSIECGGARSAFAIAMLVMASNGTPDTLTKDLLLTLQPEWRIQARDSWLPAALNSDKSKQSWEPLLEAANAEHAMPENRVVLRLAGPQLLESLLGDIIEGTPLINTSNRPEIRAIPIMVEEGRFEPHGYQNQLL